MKNALLIHGWNTKDEYYDATRPTASNDHWFPWLTKQLMLHDIITVSIEMPNGYYPQYEVWKKELERYDITPETILVGHSCGGGFLVRWLSETDIKVGKVVLVAPWLGYEIGNEPFDSTFFNFTIDPSLASKTNSLHVFVSNDDHDSIQHSVDVIMGKIKDVNVRTFESKGHFTLSSLGGPELPELAEELLQ
jgi:predicted alpha/beta hydrolase family esterase